MIYRALGIWPQECIGHRALTMASSFLTNTAMALQYREALREAMSEEMERDERTSFLMGEEVAEYNGAYKVSQGMLDQVRPPPGDRHADLRGTASPASASAPRWSGSGRSSSS